MEQKTSLTRPELLFIIIGKIFGLFPESFKPTKFDDVILELWHYELNEPRWSVKPDLVQIFQFVTGGLLSVHYCAKEKVIEIEIEALFPVDLTDRGTIQVSDEKISWIPPSGEKATNRRWAPVAESMDLILRILDQDSQLSESLKTATGKGAKYFKTYLEDARQRQTNSG